MNKDEIFIDGIRKYICVGYSETERPIYVLSPEYEKYIREKEKSPQNLPKADAYSLLADVRAWLKQNAKDPDTFHVDEQVVSVDRLDDFLFKYISTKLN